MKQGYKPLLEGFQTSELPCFECKPHSQTEKKRQALCPALTAMSPHPALPRGDPTQLTQGEAVGRVSCPLASCFPKVKNLTLCQLCQPKVPPPAGTW